MTDLKTAILPRFDRVLVEKLPEEDKTKSGLIIPDTAKGKAPLVMAKVLSVGPKVENLKPGDIVGFQNGAGTEVEENEVKRLIIRDQDLMMIFDRPGK